MISLLTVSETLAAASLVMEQGPVKICLSEQQEEN